jgi:hypothetical protein
VCGGGYNRGSGKGFLRGDIHRVLKIVSMGAIQVYGGESIPESKTGYKSQKLAQVTHLRDNGGDHLPGREWVDRGSGRRGSHREVRQAVQSLMGENFGFY